ncbi:MAG: hypothetical protein AABY22_24540 [Nanoarchaeota archaeon]
MKTKFKQVPSFWWDFHYRDNEIYSIIVQSDSDKYPYVGEFVIPTTLDATLQIEQADKLIDELKSGRKVPKNYDLKR